MGWARARAKNRIWGRPPNFQCGLHSACQIVQGCPEISLTDLLESRGWNITEQKRPPHLPEDGPDQLKYVCRQDRSNVLYLQCLVELAALFARGLTACGRLLAKPLLTSWANISWKTQSIWSRPCNYLGHSGKCRITFCPLPKRIYIVYDAACAVKV